MTAVSTGVDIGRLSPEVAHTPGPMPWKASLLLGAGMFVVGSVSPLYDTYVPALLQRHLGRSVWVGAAMGIDNVLALCLVPVVGALSDGTRTRLGRRLPFVLATLPIAALALAAIPAADARGIVALLGAIVVLNVALSIWRAPFYALLAELIPSQHRSKTGGVFGVAMCLGAMLVLGTARTLSARNPALPFMLAAMLIGIVWVLHAALLREPHDASQALHTATERASPLRALREAFAAGNGLAPRFFLACLFFQMAFQSFSSWFTLHGSERFHTTVADASLGFIAVAISTLVGSMPAGWLGARYGRRRIVLIGIGGMIAACLALHLAPTLSAAVAFCALFGLSWSLPTANLIPMTLELGTAARAGSLAGAFLLVQSVAGVLGPAIVGGAFDVTGTKRLLFVLLAVFLASAFALLATLRPGFGEARQ